MKKAPRSTIDAELHMLRVGIKAVLDDGGFSPREKKQIARPAREARAFINEFIRARERGDLNEAAYCAYQAGRLAQAVFDIDNAKDERGEGRVNRVNTCSKRDAEIMRGVEAQLRSTYGLPGQKELHDGYIARGGDISYKTFCAVLKRGNWRVLRRSIRTNFLV